MKAIVQNEFGTAEVLQEKELPLPKLCRHEVRIKVKAMSFNPVDVKIRSGIFGGKFPLILGADCSGVIDAVGNEFGEFSVGDEVAAFVFGPCSNGAYAEYVCLPTQFVIKKPKNLTLEEAAAFPLTYLTAFQALIAPALFQQNRSLFIAGGGGGVGSAAIALAKCYKGGPIFTTAGSKESQKYLSDYFGLSKENILSYRELSLDQIKEKAIALNGGELFYLTFDCVGAGMKQLCFSLCDFYGFFVTLNPDDETFPIPIWGREEHSAFNRSISIHPLFVGCAALYGDEKSWNLYKVQLRQLVHLFEKESLIPPKVENVGPFSLETVKKAHRRLEEGTVQGKLVMTV